jgi:hypothetical protein
MGVQELAHSRVSHIQGFTSSGNRTLFAAITVGFAALAPRWFVLCTLLVTARSLLVESHPCAVLDCRSLQSACHLLETRSALASLAEPEFSHIFGLYKLGRNLGLVSWWLGAVPSWRLSRAQLGVEPGPSPNLAQVSFPPYPPG